MTNQIFTATGCARCKIAKGFMAKNNIEFQAFDIKAEGKDEFARFYRANRSNIYRDQDGVEFPVFTDGTIIRQGLSVIIGHLTAGTALDGYIGQNKLHGEWINGFNLSGGDPDQADALISVLGYLKKHGLKLLMTASGTNADVLEKVLDKKLGDRMIMEVKGPASLYGALTGQEVSTDDIAKSIALAARFPEYEFFTSISPVELADGTVRYLTPDEIAETAKMIEDATKSKKHPYRLKRPGLESVRDEPLKSVEPLPETAMFKYRTAARRYLVMTEIEK